MLITLILPVMMSAFSAKADGYVDIGYNDGLLIESSIRIKNMFYIQAARGKEVDFYGCGVGFTKKNYTLMLMANKPKAAGYNVELKISYYDTGRFSFSNTT